MDHFPIEIATLWRGPLLLIGATPKKAYAVLGDSALALRFGWWKLALDYEKISAVRLGTWPWYLGVGMRLGPEEGLGLIGRTGPTAIITLREAMTFKVPFPLSRRRLDLSVAQPEAFAAALTARLR